MKNIIHLSQGFFVVLFSLTLISCSSKKSDIGPVENNTSYLSEADRDGQVSKGSTGCTSGATGTSLYLGDNASNKSFRAFVSFLHNIPAGATIESAVLRIYSFHRDATPFTDLGNVIVDHLEYGLLDAGCDDFDMTGDNIGTLATAYAVGYQSLDVKNVLMTDVAAGKTRTQFRFYHTLGTDNNNDQDLGYWYSGDSLNNQPVLEVTYIN